MKRIRGIISNNDRITISAVQGMIHFYYQSSKTNDREYLFSQKFSKSVNCYFGGQGKTIRELYSFHKWSNHKLSNVLTRIPIEIDYFMREN